MSGPRFRRSVAQLQIARSADRSDEIVLVCVEKRYAKLHGDDRHDMRATSLAAAEISVCRQARRPTTQDLIR